MGGRGVSKKNNTGRPFSNGMLCRVAYLTTCNFTQMPKNWNSSLLYYFQLKIKLGSGISEHMQEAVSVDKVLG